MTRRSTLADLQGAARLATEATAGLADLVETMHERIARLPGVGAASPPGRTRGITGLVYKSVRGVTRVVGGSVDVLLGLVGRALEPAETGPEREALVAALNGVLGDHLAATSNPLATTMSFRRDGRTLVLETAALAADLPDAGDRLLVLIHGLCMNDLQWSREGHDHGAALAQTAGFTPVYLRYNSGRHISVNGRELAQQLEKLTTLWPQPLARVVLIGHSMGGLVARSALHHATQSGLRWPAQLSELVFLGTPHHGAPLERAGSWVDMLLGATPYAAPFARLGQLRSAGITDLRHGNLVDADWADVDRFARGKDRRQHLPLPPQVACFAAAASLGRADAELKGRLLGDGLVPLDSALGRHADPARTLAFAADRQWIAREMGHLDLLHRAEVTAQLRRWLG